MIILYIAALLLVVVLLYLYEWPKIGKGKKKERAAFVVLTAFDMILSCLLILYPDMPGPSQWVHWLFRPFYPLLQ